MQELKFISTVYLFSYTFKTSHTLLRSSKFGLLLIVETNTFRCVRTMHKSAYKLELFLMASLIMLTVSILVAIPMDSTKLFQNAMESGKHSDKNYKYQENEKNYYYSDEGDNRYSPDYNYYQYYQPM